MTQYSDAVYNALFMLRGLTEIANESDDTKKLNIQLKILDNEELTPTERLGGTYDILLGMYHIYLDMKPTEAVDQENFEYMLPRIKQCLDEVQPLLGY